jgi:predicted PurR-regulated permease PerM
MANKDQDRDGLVSESIVQLLFNQVKSSSDSNAEAIKDLTEAITELIKAIGTKPADTIKKIEDTTLELKTVNDNLGKIQQNFTKFFWICGITFAIITIVFTVISFLKTWFPSGIPST